MDPRRAGDSSRAGKKRDYGTNCAKNAVPAPLQEGRFEYEGELLGEIEFILGLREDLQQGTPATFATSPSDPIATVFTRQIKAGDVRDSALPAARQLPHSFGKDLGQLFLGDKLPLHAIPWSRSPAPSIRDSP
jgi:hypothetical protein